MKLSRHMAAQLLCWGALLSVLAVWSFDREPPFTILKYIRPDPVKAGHPVVFAMPVVRDLSRNCDVQFTRHLLDGGGVRYDYTSLREPKGDADSRVQFMSAEGIAEMDKSMGPWLRVAVVIPPGSIPSGRDAGLGTELRYRCNPLHIWFPIKVSLNFPFDILPP